MSETGAGTTVFRQTRRNAILTWSLFGILAFVIAETVADGDLLWGGFGVIVALLVLLPPVELRRVTITLPWELLVVAVVPLATRAVIRDTLIGQVITHLAIAAVSLIITVELQAFTAVRMTDWFASLIVFVTTVATMGAWAIIQWMADTTFGTMYVSSNHALMILFSASLLAGGIAGLLSYVYFQYIGPQLPTTSEDSSPDQHTHDRPTPRSLSQQLGIPSTRQRQAVRILQGLLVGILLVGLLRIDLSIVVNSAIALMVTELPALLKRDLDLTLGPGLTLWLVLAVTVHAVGMLGPYQHVWWWDNVAHSLSASVIAIVGYATIRAVDVYLPAIYLPSRAMFLITLSVVLAAGVLWEVIEFSVSEVAAYVGAGPVIIQFGLDDTMVDLLFDSAGGVVVAVWGTPYIAGTVEELVRWLEMGD